MDYYKDKAEVTLICVCTCIMGHSILYPHPPYGRGQSKFTPSEIKEQKCRHVPPPQKLPKFSFPLRKKPIFFHIPSEIFKRSKAPTQRAPRKWRSKAPQKISSIGGGGVDIKWNDPTQFPPLFITVIILIAPPGGVKDHKWAPYSKILIYLLCDAPS